MQTECTDYMYECEWTEDFLKRTAVNYHSDVVPEIKEVKDATILPQKDAEGHPWGLGGAVYPDGAFVEESRMGETFGGSYPIKQEDVIDTKEKVYYIPIIPRHWGHFLLDVLCRFWFIANGTDEGCRIAFCGKDFPDHQITGNYLEALNLLGIEESRLLFVDKPMRFSKIMIPEASYGDGKPYTDAYLAVIRWLKEKALTSKAIEDLQPIEKIYFTRTRFRRARMTEIGEKEIEELFHKNGFTVLAPEQLTVTEQIFYFSSAKEIAAISGTISHNIVFCESGTEVAILNRCCLPNMAQFSINQISKARITYIDVYAKETMRRPKYWPVWVEVNQSLLRFLDDKGYTEGRPSPFLMAKTKGNYFLQYQLLNMKMGVKRALRVIDLKSQCFI